MIKAILFDADGVTIKNHRYFSQRFSEDFNVPMEKILPFLQEDLKQCSIGKGDLKQSLIKYIPLWGYTKTPEELMEYWFEGEKEIDNQVIKFVKELKNKGIKCYLVSDNEWYRATYLKEKINLNTIFDNCFFSCDLGVKKSNPEFFVKVYQTTNLKPEELMYFDDDTKNVDIASSQGIDAHTYTEFQKMKTEIKEKLK